MTHYLDLKFEKADPVRWTSISLAGEPYCNLRTIFRSGRGPCPRSPIDHWPESGTPKILNCKRAISHHSILGIPGL